MRRVLIPIIICADEFDRWSYAGCFPAYGYQSIEEDGNLLLVVSWCQFLFVPSGRLTSPFDEVNFIG